MENRNSEGDDNQFKINWNLDSQPELKLGDFVPNSLGYGCFTSHIPVSSNTKQFSRKILPSHQKGKQHTRAKLSPLTSSQGYLMEKRLRDAANSSDIDVVVDLINKGVNVSAPDSKGRTALHFAATQNNEFLIKVLLDCGADPNAKDVNENTPLHLAACGNHINIVTQLLREGTDVQLVDQSGRTPLDVAISRLRVMHGSERILSYSKYRFEVLQIIDMLKVYSSKAGWYKEKEELDQLCYKLSSAATLEQVRNHFLFSTCSLEIIIIFINQIFILFVWPY